MMQEQGPEAVKPLMDEFFRRCTDIVVRNDGIVDHFLGDAVLAFFNCPIRRDDHIARAVSVGSQIQLDVLRFGAQGEEGPLKIGIGIGTGFAYTGTVGSSDCKDYTAIGQVVNIAARLQGLASPGEILVIEQVYEQVRSAFPNAQKRDFDLKGIPGQVHAYCLS